MDLTVQSLAILYAHLSDPQIKGVSNVCKSLLKHWLIQEGAATDLNTVYRVDNRKRMKPLWPGSLSRHRATPWTSGVGPLSTIAASA